MEKEIQGETSRENVDLCHRVGWVLVEVEVGTLHGKLNIPELFCLFILGINVAA